MCTVEKVQAKWMCCNPIRCFLSAYMFGLHRELAIWKTSETISQWYFERVNSPRFASFMVQVSLSSHSKCCLLYLSDNYYFFFLLCCFTFDLRATTWTEHEKLLPSLCARAFDNLWYLQFLIWVAQQQVPRSAIITAIIQAFQVNSACSA